MRKIDRNKLKKKFKECVEYSINDGKIKVGQEFKNLKGLCEWIGVEYSSGSTERSIMWVVLEKYLGIDRVEGSQRLRVSEVYEIGGDCGDENKVKGKIKDINMSNNIVGEEVNFIMIDMMVNCVNVSVGVSERNEKSEKVRVYDGIMKNSKERKVVEIDKSVGIGCKEICQILGIWREIGRREICDEVFRKVVENYQRVCKLVVRGTMEMLGDSGSNSSNGSDDFFVVKEGKIIKENKRKTKGGGIKHDREYDMVYWIKRKVGNDKIIGYGNLGEVGDAVQSVINSWWEEILEVLMNEDKCILSEISGGVSKEEYRRYWDVVKMGGFVGRVRVW